MKWMLILSQLRCLQKWQTEKNNSSFIKAYAPSCIFGKILITSSLFTTSPVAEDLYQVGCYHNMKKTVDVNL